MAAELTFKKIFEEALLGGEPVSLEEFIDSLWETPEEAYAHVLGCSQGIIRSKLSFAFKYGADSLEYEAVEKHSTRVYLWKRGERLLGFEMDRMSKKTDLDFWSVLEQYSGLTASGEKKSHYETFVANSFNLIPISEAEADALIAGGSVQAILEDKISPSPVMGVTFDIKREGNHIYFNNFQYHPVNLSKKIS